MLLYWIILYLLATLVIGIYSSTKIQSSKDFMLAGKKLPLLMAIATVFSTWFGSETILGSSVEIAKHGVQGVIEEPFGAALGLILVGLFIARPLYRKNYLTLGDFFRDTFGFQAERIASVLIIFSYFGWIAAQMVAMGLILGKIAGIQTETGMIITSMFVIFYTWSGGLWAVSLTDSIQMILIIIGLGVLAFSISQEINFQSLRLNTPPNYFHFFPENTFHGWIYWISAIITLGLGSIPQQDVFQRIMASKNENIASLSSLIAGFLYLSVALIPLSLGVLFRENLSSLDEPQLLIPNLVLYNTPEFVQIFFFGSLLSAIMSTASGAIIAPSSILSENIIRPLYHLKLQDKHFLYFNRLSVILISLISLVIAFIQRNIYQLVADASAFGLVSLFIPMMAGLFFGSKNERAAIFSMLSGITTWFIAIYYTSIIPETIVGLCGGFAGFIAGVLFKKNKIFTH